MPLNKSRKGCKKGASFLSCDENSFPFLVSFSKSDLMNQLWRAKKKLSHSVLELRSYIFTYFKITTAYYWHTSYPSSSWIPFPQAWELLSSLSRELEQKCGHPLLFLPSLYCVILHIGCTWVNLERMAFAVIISLALHKNREWKFDANGIEGSSKFSKPICICFPKQVSSLNGGGASKNSNFQLKCNEHLK